VINAGLERDEDNPVKQRHSAKQIIDQLRHEFGHTGG
jgi:hypothetical protein